MAAYMYEKGIAEHRVFIEDKATSTEENFKFSKIILDEHFADEYTTAYVTTDFHIYRAGGFAKQAGFNDCLGMSSVSAWWMWPNFYLREFAAIVHGII